MYVFSKVFKKIHRVINHWSVSYINTQNFFTLHNTTNKRGILTTKFIFHIKHLPEVDHLYTTFFFLKAHIIYSFSY